MGARCTVDGTKPRVLVIGHGPQDSDKTGKPADKEETVPSKDSVMESKTSEADSKEILSEGKTNSPEKDVLDSDSVERTSDVKSGLTDSKEVVVTSESRATESVNSATERQSAEAVDGRQREGSVSLYQSDSGHHSVGTPPESPVPSQDTLNTTSLSRPVSPAPAASLHTTPEPCRLECTTATGEEQEDEESRWMELTGTDPVDDGSGTHTEPVESVVMAMSQLKLTKAAPEWRGTAVVDGEFKEISLSEYRGKYLVFFFYPLDFTFVCPTEIIAFSERVEEFRSIGCEVVACSTDSHFSHLAWVNTPRKQGGLGQMNIPLLADKTCEVAKAYGVLKEDEGIAFRGLFIIDDKGNLRQITINDLPVGRSVDETLRLVQAFQFTDKHGEVCPAGWKPGKATMKPDVKKSKSYFEDNA